MPDQDQPQKSGQPTRRDIIAATIAGGLAMTSTMESVPREQQTMVRARRMADMLIDELDSGRRG